MWRVRDFMRTTDLSRYSNEQLMSIEKRLNYWKWDKRLGRKPFMFDKLNNYKKPHNMKFRMESLFRVVWPFTKESYIRPIMDEIEQRLHKK